MNTNLVELEKAERLILPGPSIWGGSFSGMDEIYMGDESQLVFVRASGSVETNARTITLTCLFRNNEVHAAVQILDDDLDKERLIKALNHHHGKRLGLIWNESLEI